MLLAVLVHVLSGAVVNIGGPQPTVPLLFPIADNVSPSGDVMSATNRSVTLNGEGWYGVGGEAQYARMPQSMWKPALQKMKAGGITMVQTYAFWVHHEEVEGKFSFEGRRDIRSFVKLCDELGFKVMVRIGPWDFGESRNAGHPDWLVRASKDGNFPLRQNNTEYVSFATSWFKQLAAQLDGLYFKDGGPIIFAQLGDYDGYPDWEILEQMRTVAIGLGIRPPFFTAVSTLDAPANYPFLYFEGEYPDRFWTTSMKPEPSSSGYFFTPAPNSRFPPLGVEIGSGMEVAYNHRPHMTPNDMPTWHHYKIGSGLNWIGYYLYHGGNNPEAASGDAPKDGYQESTFQPSGPANPMPSKTYDFYAPIGEFGQLRPHYHTMRRQNIFLKTYGSFLTTCDVFQPEVLPSPIPGDNTTLRWTVRSNGTAGFIFVNNYERLNPLSAKTVQGGFTVNLPGETLSIPGSDVTVQSGAWFTWPFNFESIKYATAELLHSRMLVTGKVVILKQTNGIAPVIALPFEYVDVVVAYKGQKVLKNGLFIFSGFEASRECAIEIINSLGLTVTYLVLSEEDSLRLWEGVINSVPFFAISSSDVQAVVTNGTKVFVEGDTVNGDSYLSLFPKMNISMDGVCQIPSDDGYFWKFSIPFKSAPLPTVKVTQRAPAGPPRALMYSSANFTIEPNAAEWEAAAVFSLQLTSEVPTGDLDYFIEIPYQGDAARLYYNKTYLITDNWFTGYNGDGSMQVSYTKLVDELPGILSPSTPLTLKVLPSTREYLQKFTFLQPQYWPALNPNSSISLSLGSIETKPYYLVQLSLC